jgi:hypothetical protein
MPRTIAISALALAAAFIAAPTAADAGVRAGMLECRGIESTSYVIGSVAHMQCVFHPGVGRSQAYRATIHRLGVDLGFTNGERVSWLVFAPTAVVGPGDLAGTYGGVSAGATVGVGVGANALVGGWQNSFALQPLSLQGQTGLNVSGGLAQLDLVAEPEVRRHRRHHRRHH